MKFENVAKLNNKGSIFRFVLCCLLLFIAPFARGLFFEQYLLPFLIVLSVLFISYIHEQFKEKDTRFFSDPLDWAMLALLGAYILSLFMAVNIRLAILGAVKVAACIIVYWICFRASRQEKGVHYLFLTFYLAGVFMALISLFMYCGLIHYPYALQVDRVSGLLEYPNSMGAYVAVIFMLGWGLLMNCDNRWIRMAMAGGNALLLMTMVGTLSRGTWVLFPVFSLLYILMVGRKNMVSASVGWLAALVPGFLLGRLYLSNPTPKAVIYILLSIILAAGIQGLGDYIILHLNLQFNKNKKKITVGILAAALIIIVAVFAVPSLRSIFTQGSLSRLSNINWQDQNVQLRMEHYKDAFKIIKDHPITGVGAGGWEALYHHYASHLYWTTTAHNYLLQTWLESGTIGLLALAAIWLILIVLLWKVWKRLRKKNAPDLTLWSGVAAILFLGVHSLLDWDMSYPAISFLCFGLIGALKTRATMQFEGFESAAVNSNKKKKKKSAFRWNRYALSKMIFAALLSITICIFTVFLWLAGINYRSAQKIINQNPQQAIVLINKAIELDPLNASYYNLAASFWERIASSTHEQAPYNQALYYCQKATSLEPYNLTILNNANRIYTTFGDYDRSLQVANALIQSNPRDPASYENLANNQVLKGLQYLEMNQLENARTLWKESLTVANIVPQQMDVPPVGLNLTSGQALLLLGEKSQGEQSLRNMLTVSGAVVGNLTWTVQERTDQVNNMRDQSRIWLAAYLELSGNVTEAKELLNQVSKSSHPNIENEVQIVKDFLIETKSY